MRVQGWIILTLLLISAQFLNSQSHFEIMKTKLGQIKVHRVYRGETLKYKKKGTLFFRKETLVHLQDSLLIFPNERSVNINSLSKVGISRNIHLLETVESYFIVLGAGFFGLNTVNNIITDNRPIIDWTAATIGGTLVAFSQVFQLLQYKKIKISKNTSVRVVEFDYSGLDVRK